MVEQGKMQGFLLFFIIKLAKWLQDLRPYYFEQGLMFEYNACMCAYITVSLLSLALLVRGDFAALLSTV